MKSFYHFQKTVNTDNNIIHHSKFKRFTVDKVTQWNIGGIQTTVDLRLECGECGKLVESGQSMYTNGKICLCAQCYEERA